MIPFHHVFLRRPVGLVSAISIVVQHLIHSVSSLCSMSTNNLNLPFLISKLTRSNPNSSLNSAFFFLSFTINPDSVWFLSHSATLQRVLVKVVCQSVCPFVTSYRIVSTRGRAWSARRPRPPVGSTRPSPERLQHMLGAWTRAWLYYQPRRPWPPSVGLSAISTVCNMLVICQI